MNKTELIRDLQERLLLKRSEVVAILDAVEASVVEGVKKDGVAVVGNIARITKKKIPARPAGEYPGFGGEMKRYPRRPAQTKLRISMPKTLKDKL